MHRRSIGVLVVSALWTATGCVVGSARAPSRVEVAHAGTEPAAPAVLEAESPGCRPRREPRPKRPSASAIWIDGECRFDGVRFVWVPGRYETPIATGATP